MSSDRIFLRLGPNGALWTDEHQWILYPSPMWNGVNRVPVLHEGHEHLAMS